MDYICEINPHAVCSLLKSYQDGTAPYNHHLKVALFKHNRAPFDFDAEFIKQEDTPLDYSIDGDGVLTVFGEFIIPLLDQDHTRTFIFTHDNSIYLHIYCDAVMLENADKYTRSLRPLRTFSNFDIKLKPGVDTTSLEVIKAKLRVRE